MRDLGLLLLILIGLDIRRLLALGASCHIESNPPGLTTATFFSRKALFELQVDGRGEG